MLSELSTWIMSIAGIICISVMVELILPEGQMNRYIKNILSFVIILIIILPVPKLLGKELKINNIFSFDQNIEVDKDFLYQLNLDKINLIKEDIEDKIHKRGYENVSIYINCNIFENQMNFKSITVDLTNLVISQNSEHKDIIKIKKDIVSIITEILDIDEEVIYYDS